MKVLIAANVILGSIMVGLIVAIIMKVICKEKKPNATDAPSPGRFIDQRIVGGKKILVRDYPFMAAIVVKKHGIIPKDSLQCGSSIISSKWVVTAAHCITLLEEQSFTKDVVTVTSGNTNWSRGKRHTIKAWTYHKSFDARVMNEDIALINVAEPFRGENTSPIPMASGKYRYKPNIKIKVIGWGFKESVDSDVQQQLYGVEVTLYNQTYCKDLYDMQSQEVTRSMFCAGVPQGGKDACQFDSGGPIFDKKLLIGIVSWGIDCGKRYQPGVYTRIGLFEKWIIQTAKSMGDPINAKFKDKS